MENSSDEKVTATHIPDAPGAVESHAPPKISAGKYAATRFSTLKPPMNKAPNPFKLLAMLNGRQWLFFFVGFIAWVCPALQLSHCALADI
jgi:SHS family lactate transporter-like MFS transporter